MQRRDFITLLGGAAAAWPLAAKAQGERVRRIGWLIGGSEADAGPRASVAAMREALAKLGWIEGRNLHVELRFGAADPGRMRTGAAELVSLASEVIVTNLTAAARAAQQQTKTIPIVFTTAGDPVVTGLVQNIARPEGNITGFGTTEPSIAGKWLGLLKEAVPHLARVAVIFNPESGLTAPAYIAAIESAAPALSVDQDACSRRRRRCTGDRRVRSETERRPAGPVGYWN